MDNNTPNFIRGTVTTSSGTALAGIIVHIKEFGTEKEVRTETGLDGGFQYTEDLPTGLYIVEFEDPLDKFFIRSYGASLVGAPIAAINVEAINDFEPVRTGAEFEEVAAGLLATGAGGVFALYDRHQFENEKLKQYIQKGIEDRTLALEKNNLNLAYLQKQYNLTQAELYDVGNEIKRITSQKDATQRILQTQLNSNQISQDEYDRKIEALTKSLQLDRQRLNPALTQKMRETDLTDRTSHLTSKFNLDPNEKEQLRKELGEALSKKAEYEQILKQARADGQITEEEFNQRLKHLQNDLPLDPQKLNSQTRSKIRKILKEEPKELRKQIDERANQQIYFRKFTKLLKTRLATQPPPPAGQIAQPQPLPPQQPPTAPPTQPTFIATQTSRTTFPQNPLTSNVAPSHTQPQRRRRRGLPLPNQIIIRLAKGLSTFLRTPAGITAAIAASVLIIIFSVAAGSLTSLIKTDPSLPPSFNALPGLSLTLNGPTKANIGNIITYAVGVTYDLAAAQFPIEQVSIVEDIPFGTEFVEAPGGLNDSANNRIIWSLANPQSRTGFSFKLKVIPNNLYTQQGGFIISNKVYSALLSDPNASQAPSLEQMFRDAATLANIPLAFLKAIARRESSIISPTYGYTDQEVQNFMKTNWWTSYPNPDSASSFSQINDTIKRGYAYNTCQFLPPGTCFPGADVRGALQFEIQTWGSSGTGGTIANRVQGVVGRASDRRYPRDIILGAGFFIRDAINAPGGDDRFGFDQNPTDWDENQVRAMATKYCTGQFPPLGNPRDPACGGPANPYDEAVWGYYVEYKYAIPTN